MDARDARERPIFPIIDEYAMATSVLRILPETSLGIKIIVPSYTLLVFELIKAFLETASEIPFGWSKNIDFLSAKSFKPPTASM